MNASKVRWGNPESSGKRGVAFIAGFWLVITGLLGARVVLFDSIAAARAGDFLLAQLSALGAVLFG